MGTYEPMEEFGSSRPLPARSRASTNNRTEKERMRGRIPIWVPLVLFALALPIGLAQSWFGQARRSIAYDLAQLDRSVERARNEIDRTHIETERLQSPARVARIAKDMGFVPGENPPIAVAPHQRSATRSPEVAESPMRPERVSADTGVQRASAFSFVGRWPFSWGNRAHVAQGTVGE